MLPDVTSQNLEINLATVDLPTPLGPTNAVKLPALPYYPSATSKIIIKLNPSAKKSVPIFECCP